MNDTPIYPDLLIAFLSGECSMQDQVLVRQWIAASEENRAQFEAMEKLWLEADHAYPPSVTVDTEAAWRKVSQRIGPAESPLLPMRRKLTGNGGLIRKAMLAAAIVLPLLTIGLYFILRESAPEQLNLTAGQAITHATLPDGSEITLNRGGSLSYPEQFGKTRREVKLEGEAFFAVRPDPGKPFLVHTPDMKVVVKGTAFNVLAIPGTGRSEVFVKSGSVAVFALDQTEAPVDSVLLKPGEKVICRTQGHRLELLQAKNENDLFWMSKTLIFKGTELSEVFAALSKNYGVQIAAGDTALLRLRLTTSFENQPIERIMEVIAATLELNIHQTGNQYEVASARK